MKFTTFLEFPRRRWRMEEKENEEEEKRNKRKKTEVKESKIWTSKSSIQAKEKAWKVVKRSTLTTKNKPLKSHKSWSYDHKTRNQPKKETSYLKAPHRTMITIKTIPLPPNKQKGSSENYHISIKNLIHWITPYVKKKKEVIWERVRMSEKKKAYVP